MIKFNPENKESLTYGECLGPAMQITDPENAKEFFADYVAFLAKASENNPNPKFTPEQIAKANLGYYAGYYDNETRARVEKLFSCVHPVFGGVEANGSPSAEKAFSAGQQLAADSKLN